MYLYYVLKGQLFLIYQRLEASNILWLKVFPIPGLPSGVHLEKKKNNVTNYTLIKKINKGEHISKKDLLYFYS